MKSGKIRTEIFYPRKPGRFQTSVLALSEEPTTILTTPNQETQESVTTPKLNITTTSTSNAIATTLSFLAIVLL